MSEGQELTKQEVDIQSNDGNGQESNETTASAYDRLANSYRHKKVGTMYNMLECGKILHEVKQSLGYGVWCQFLKDNRVCESERTAHRILSIYKNYHHLLTDDCAEKAGNLAQLGVSHLLEFQKLPDRFKKEIEVVRETPEGKEVKEIEKVIDEEKLNDFLEQPVSHQGEQKLIRDLPLTEMKKYINEAKGLYEPDSYDSDDEAGEGEDSETEQQQPEQQTSTQPQSEETQQENVSEHPEQQEQPQSDEPQVNTDSKPTLHRSNHDNQVMQSCVQLRHTSQKLFELFNEFDKTHYDYIENNRKQAVLGELNRVINICESLIVKSNEMKEQLED